MVFEINDIDTYLEDDGLEYHESPYDYYEHIKIENNDINYVYDLYALGRGILAVLKTRIGEIDGVGMENFGCKLLTLRGENLDNTKIDLAKVYIRSIIPQFGDKIYDFPIINIKQKKRNHIVIHIRADTKYGEIDINLDL